MNYTPEKERTPIKGLIPYNEDLMLKYLDPRSYFTKHFLEALKREEAEKRLKESSEKHFQDQFKHPNISV